jgi:exopolyphosphatase/guanosine-5'-triphosphate,3'-diphosphate pyrophosphatase
VAQVARYHRKAIPQPDHGDFQNLSKADQKLVLVLGGILRLADALDRTHTGKIERLSSTATDEALIIKVKPRGSWNDERAMFEVKRDMLELAAKRAVRVEA